ncbi:hypothetical protein EAX61_11050 [Dokdonia sinensis]|uniref:FAD-dependent urate hydroxylase HpyO/Asp monooxygenase CreE-like FAD/NAD(P)-binding domain-containing protein n=1 Tax=Dokdonia sinensis TaxID=2479847 RepID=A0A3M0G5U7_9FLAO|nr:FAD/NAD(P)-binding protein [Dokdonia sinensis]RMB57642.1 hypothetical protein EAX61_11050 [Dokdonia sinensis]
MNQPTKHLAIVGGGPRGLYALESLYLALHNSDTHKKLKITLFEPFRHRGSGWVWSPSQVDTNWLNITERALQNLPGRPEMRIGETIIPSFPSYTEWLPKEEQNPPATHPDQFPPRAKMGTYLNARFETIAQTLMGSGWLEIIEGGVTKLDYDGRFFTACAKANNTPIHNNDNQDAEHFEISHIDEVVLTIGHQDTELSDQLKSWKAHVAKAKTPLLFTEAYPIEKILEAKIDAENTVAFRGFGLAMIDQIRALTLKKGGRFEVINEETQELTYYSSAEHPQQFVAFSLDGLPMVPKPLNEAIDNQFMPSDEALKTFAKAVHQGACGKHSAEHHYFLMEEIATVVVPVFQKLGDSAWSHDLTDEELYYLIINYLNDQSLEHELLLLHKIPVIEMMEMQVAMATSNGKISLDYCVGQVWRHCQPSIYSEFSYPDLRDNVIAEVIALDEASKRYSYGPPVESIQQLIALHKAGFLNLDFVNNPDITLVDDGWQLESNGKKIIVDVMLNAVLDPPKLVTVTAPIIKNLMESDVIEALHTDLGIRTDDYGYVETPEGKSFIPLAVLGRLSKGSVIGVDAILECFGERIRNWAERSVAQMIDTKKTDG